MKHIIKQILVVLTTVAISTQIDAVNPTRKKLTRKSRTKQVAKESPAMQVDKEVSALDNIVEQANIVVNTEEFIKTDVTPRRIREVRAEARNSIKNSMKDLETHIADEINDDINIILKFGKTEESKKAARQALERLTAVVGVMSAQGRVIDVMEEGKRAIELAPAHMKEAVIAETVQNVQIAEAQAEEAGMLAHMAGTVKSVLAAPGNYFFGEQRTALKTAVEVAVGTAVVGGLGYLGYKYGPGVKASAAEAFAGLKERFYGKPAEEVTSEKATRPSLKSKEAKQAAKKRREKGEAKPSLFEKAKNSKLYQSTKKALTPYTEEEMEQAWQEQQGSILLTPEEKREMELEQQLTQQERLQAEAALKGASLKEK